MSERTCVELKFEPGEQVLRIVNSCGSEIRVASVRVEYVLRRLAYDKPEHSEHRRRVIEDIKVHTILVPRGELRIRMRDVERIERVCVSYNERFECYQLSSDVPTPGSQD